MKERRWLNLNRGTFWAITKEEGKHKVWKSIEFNGGMDLDQYGLECYKELVEVNNFHEFTEFADKFKEQRGESSLQADSVYLANEYSNPWIGDHNKMVWDYRESKHIDLFNTNLPISDYNYIKNLTEEVITLKSRNGVFALPPQGVMVTEFDKSLNNKRNYEKYGITQLFRGENRKIPDTVTEWCPWCEQEVEIASSGLSRCSNCGKWLIPCSICKNNGDCEDCVSDKLAKKKNADDLKGV